MLPPKICHTFLTKRLSSKSDTNLKRKGTHSTDPWCVNGSRTLLFSPELTSSTMPGLRRCLIFPNPSAYYSQNWDLFLARVGVVETCQKLCGEKYHNLQFHTFSVAIFGTMKINLFFFIPRYKICLRALKDTSSANSYLFCGMSLLV